AAQVLLGHGLLVLRETGGRLHGRSEDGYLGWVHCGYVRRVAETGAREWELGAGGEACLSLGAQLRDASGEVFARLPWGSRLRLRGTEAGVPDGRTGAPEGEWVPLGSGRERLPPGGAAVVGAAGRRRGAVSGRA